MKTITVITIILTAAAILVMTGTPWSIDPASQVASLGTGEKSRCSYHMPQENLSSCELAGADLSYLDLSDSIMVDIDLRKANMSGTYAVNANMHRAHMQKAYLGIAVLDYAVMSKANLREAYLGGASLWNVNLTDADLSGADLSNANLRYAVMDKTNLNGVIWNNTVCPDGTNSDMPDGDGYTCFYNMK